MALVDEWRKGIEHKLTLTTDVLLGDPIDEFLGGGREENGVVHDVRDIKFQLANGAMKPEFKLTRKQKFWLAIATLGVTFVSPFLVATISGG